MQGPNNATSDGFATTTVMKSKMKWRSLEVVGTKIFAASGRDIYRSTDGAKSWKKLATLPSEISSISVNAQIFAALAGNTIFVSKDAGKSFTS